MAIKLLKAIQRVSPELIGKVQPSPIQKDSLIPNQRFIGKPRAIMILRLIGKASPIALNLNVRTVLIVRA